MDKDKLNLEIDKILQRAEKENDVKASPFFTTRLLGKIENREDRFRIFSSFQLNTIIKPALVVLLIVNLMNLYLFRGIKESNYSGTDNQIIQAENTFLYTSNDFVYTEELLTQK